MLGSARKRAGNGGRGGLGGPCGRLLRRDGEWGVRARKAVAEAGGHVSVLAGSPVLLHKRLGPGFHPEGCREGASTTHIPAGSGSHEMSQDSKIA